jgi:hypothetical protein
MYLLGPYRGCDSAPFGQGQQTGIRMEPGGKNEGVTEKNGGKMGKNGVGSGHLPLILCKKALDPTLHLGHGRGIRSTHPSVK